MTNFDGMNFVRPALFLLIFSLAIALDIDKKKTQKRYKNQTTTSGNPWWLGDRLLPHHGFRNVYSPKPRKLNEIESFS